MQEVSRLKKSYKIPKYYRYFEKEVLDSYLPEMKSTIGVIDIKMIEDRTEKSLYYLFPLVERIVVEILKYKPDTDIEFSEQGTYRTLNSILSVNKNAKYFDDDIVALIKQYYSEEGLRNKMLHFRGQDNIEISMVDLLGIKVIVTKLLKKYKLTLENIEKTLDNDIELL